MAFFTAQTWTGDYFRVQGSTDPTTNDLITTAVAWRIESSATPPASIATALRTTGELTVTAGTRSPQITASDSPTALAWQSAAGCP